MIQREEIYQIANREMSQRLANVQGVGPNPCYPYPERDENYIVPDYFAIYSHPLITLPAFATLNAEFLTQNYRFWVESMVSNASVIAGAPNVLTCSAQLGQAGNAPYQMQSQVSDAMVWYPPYRQRARIDELWRLYAQQRISFQYHNLGAQELDNIQSAWIGYQDVPGLHFPYLIDNFPYDYVTDPVELAAPIGSTATVQFTIDPQKDFYLREIVGNWQNNNNVLVQIINIGSQYRWVTAGSQDVIAGVLLDNIAYNWNTTNLSPLGFSPVVMRHLHTYQIVFTNAGGHRETGLQLAFRGNNCFYERTSLAESYIRNM